MRGMQNKVDCKSILFYADCTLDDNIGKVCRESIQRASLPITSVTIKPMDFGRNFVSPTPKSYQTLFENILMGLERITDEIVFFCEADILYHPSHFEFTPEKHDTIYYNGNYWVVRLSDGFAVHYDMGPLSGLCAYRDILLKHYKERVEYVRKNGFDYRMGFEPMTHRRIKWKNMYRMERFYPEFPNLDLYHGANLTRRKWAPDKFVTRPKFWEESTVKNIPGWANLPELVESMKYGL
jgi:hypothetical protein